MLSVKTLNIEKEDNIFAYNLSYPQIDYEIKKNIVNQINQKIYEDIISFKNALEDISDMNNQPSYISTNYHTMYNKNGIISIPIEFAQLDGLYKITYINSYNYDIDLEKEINIKDVFNSNIDYMKIISEKVENKIKELSRSLTMDKYIIVLDYLKDIIYTDNPTFYIEKDGIVICFSSYELDPSIEDISVFKISFTEDRDYLSKYIIEKINQN